MIGSVAAFYNGSITSGGNSQQPPWVLKDQPMKKRTDIFPKIVAAGLTVGVVFGLFLGLNSANASQNDSIGFANFGSISDWKAESNRSMILTTTSGEKYRATFMGRCHALPYAETVGFVTSPGGSFDKFGAVLVRDQKCMIRSLERIG
jgi:hypothetical protein